MRELLVEKWRPQTIEECVLPERNRKIFEGWIKNKFIPNTIFKGLHGTGKTSVAKALCRSIGAEFMVINGSLNGNIDTLRQEIANFASTVSFSGGRKYVLLDEADYLNLNSTQPALRNFMEEFSKNCGFIFTANYDNRIIPALKSRCSEISFNLDDTEKKLVAAQFYKRVIYILDEEKISYENLVIKQLVIKHFPDFRKILNEIQMNSSSDMTITSDILSSVDNKKLKDLINILKNKEFTKARKWAGENSDIQFNEFVRLFYDNAYEFISDNYIPEAIIILNKFDYQNAFVSDKEINMMAALTELMSKIQWK